MNADLIRSPASFLGQELSGVSHSEMLEEYEHWWNKEGANISEATDRAGTPWLRMFDKAGKRVDEILFAPEYWRMLREGYRRGVLWRAFAGQSLLPSFQLIYVTGFYDPGLACPYTVSLSTAVPLEKYGSPALKDQFLPRLLERNGNNWQGATWMTELKGGSDLGSAVETIARRAGDHWLLSGDKYFASNVGAELAVVAARVEGAPHNVRGLALFLVPRCRMNGELNYFIRRLKDKIATRSVPTGEVELRDAEAWLLGEPELGIYLILEVLNISRVANSIGSVAVAQRAIAEAFQYAQSRQAFGKPIIEHPLLRRQFDERWQELRAASALAWASAQMLDEVVRDKPPYSERYHLFRLLAHLAKYWTAEFAVQTAKWNMEVHGGIGTLQEFGCDRWLRESMILSIWEGTSHRQILDGLEVMERKHAHRLLLRRLAPVTSASHLKVMQDRIESHLRLPSDEKQSTAEALFRDLAVFVGQALLREHASAHRPAAIPA